MTFQDRFPKQIEFEIDRAALKGIYRIQAAVLCYGLPLFFSFLLSISVFAEYLKAHGRMAGWEWWTAGTQYVSIGIAVGLLIGSAFYFGYFHRSAELTANNQRLIVEGPFLRLVTGGYVVVDRRFHFRDIHTYTTIEGPILRRCGLKTLMFRTDQRQAQPIQIDGLKNADQVRDMLCEIDALRTNDVQSG